VFMNILSNAIQAIENKGTIKIKTSTEKGTQGKRIAKRFEIQHVSSGTLFRNAALQGSSLGKQTESYLKDGFLFPMNWPLSL